MFSSLERATFAGIARYGRLAAHLAMAYQFHTIFCATPGDMEPERDEFYAVIGEFNENEAMKKGILFVAISIVPQLFNLAAYQGPIDENIRSSRHYIQVLGESWGPPNRNFEGMFELARKCEADPAMPMREVVLMCKATAPERSVEPRVLEVRREAAECRVRGVEFGDIDSYRQKLRGLFSEWLADVTNGSAGAADGRV
jgi:hypothetical protein